MLTSPLPGAARMTKATPAVTMMMAITAMVSCGDGPVVGEDHSAASDTFAKAHTTHVFTTTRFTTTTVTISTTHVTTILI